MEQCTLIETLSPESNRVVELLNENNIEYQSTLEYSDVAKPVLFTPEGIYPYKGFEDIKNYVNAIKTLHTYVINGV